MKFAICLLAALSLSGSVSAALPPLWQNVAELKAILADKKLGDHLESGESIVVIKKTEKGWIIVTNHHALPVHVVYKDAKMPGPADFDIEFGTAHSHTEADE